jgi:hypothetical protein
MTTVFYNIPTKMNPLRWQLIVIGIYIFSAPSQVRSESGPKFGLGPGLRFFKAQALGNSKASKPGQARTSLPHDLDDEDDDAELIQADNSS